MEKTKWMYPSDNSIIKISNEYIRNKIKPIITIIK